MCLLFHHIDDLLFNNISQYVMFEFTTFHQGNVSYCSTLYCHLYDCALTLLYSNTKNQFLPLKVYKINVSVINQRP